jgi:hypothetical protein
MKQKLALTLAAAFILAIGCYMLWSLVQSEQESNRLAITWRTGTGKPGLVTGTLRDRRGNPIPNQPLTIITAAAPIPVTTDKDGTFSIESPSPAITALEIPDIEPFKFGPAIPNAQQGVTLEITVK